MLVELKVSNFAIIEDIHLRFKSGLNILTGETGAGKSVLLKSLSLLMGVKGSSESVQTGFNYAAIEGLFDISNRPDIQKKLTALAINSEDQSLIVKRVLSLEDKSRIYINGSISTLGNLRDLVAPLIEMAGGSVPLIEMTGQFDNRHLLSKTYHLDLLDQYAGCLGPRHEYQKLYSEWKNTLEKIKSCEFSNQSKTQNLDFLTFQLNEIENFNPDPQKDENLENEIRILKNSNRLLEFINQSEDLLVSGNDSVFQRLSFIQRQASDLVQMDVELANQMGSLKNIQSLIEDLAYNLHQHAETITSDSQKLENLEQRLSQLRKLQKKFGPHIQDILKARERIISEMRDLENDEHRISLLKKKAETLELNLKKIAGDLHHRRQEVSHQLVDSVNEELKDLNMKGVRFHVEITELSALSLTGLSDVEFMSQASNQEPHRSLGRFASGGELSRILLSLKQVVGSGQYPRTYLFDEVDAGVSGETAEKVGRKLHSIAQGQQVICVTHLPQVAAHGDAHFFIHKSPPKQGSSSIMEVQELNKHDRVHEIARLISGEKISKTSLAHAQELLKHLPSMPL